MLKNAKLKAFIVAIVSFWRPVQIKRKGRAWVGIGYKFSRFLSLFFDVRYTRKRKVWIQLRGRK